MKTALVTGISKGIGKAICEQLITEGYFVHGTYNTGKKQAEELKQKYKENLQIYQVDLSIREQTLNLVEKLKQFKFDAIVNNAGIFIDDSLENTDLKAWDKQIEVMLTAPNIIIRNTVQSLNSGAGIVNVCSIYGETFYPNDSLGYLSAKAGVQALTKALSTSFAGKNIRINGVAPGLVNTTIAGELPKDFVQSVTEETPLKELCKPDYIANVVSFLLSNKSYFINGEVIVVDGGYTNYDHLFSL